MNLILLPELVSKFHLEVNDSRAVHLRDVMQVKNEDLVDLAVRNGPKGKGRVFVCEDGAIELDIQWAPEYSNDPVSYTHLTLPTMMSV